VPLTALSVTGAPLEYKGIKIGTEVEVTGGGYRIGHRGTVFFIDTESAAHRFGERGAEITNGSLWRVHVTMASGRPVLFRMADLEKFTPPAPAPPEPYIPASTAIAKLHALETEVRAEIESAKRIYVATAEVESDAHRAWLTASRGADMSAEEWNKHVAQLSLAWNLAIEAREFAQKAYVESQNKLKKRWREEILYHAEPAQIKVVYDARFTGEAKTEIENGIEAFKRMVGRGRLDGLTITVKRTKDSRAFYVSDTVNFPNQMRAGRTVVHELGHWMEDRNDDAAKIVDASFKERTSGEPLTPMGLGYRTSEKTYRDKFLDPYMGKDYGAPRAHEMLSMGIEWMHEDPITLLEKDLQTFEIVWHILHTGSHVVPSSGEVVQKRE
jgi:hypothetical protein